MADGVALDASVYRRMPELLARASAVLLEVGKGPSALRYVIDLVQPGSEVGKLVVKLDQPGKVKIDGQRTAVKMNLVRTATVMDPNALKDCQAYQLLWGRL